MGQGQLQALTDFEIVEPPLPGQPDLDRPQQFPFAGETPGDVSLGHVLRLRIRQRFGNSRRIVANLGRQFGRQIDPQILHAAVANVEKEIRLELDHTRIDARDQQLSGRDIGLAALDLQAELDGRLGEDERRHRSPAGRLIRSGLDRRAGSAGQGLCQRYAAQPGRFSGIGAQTFRRVDHQAAAGAFNRFRRDAGDG